MHPQREPPIYLVPEHSITPQEPCTTELSLITHLPPAPGNALSTFCLWICLFWTFYMHGIICYVSLCDRLLSLSTVLSAATHLAAASELCSFRQLQNISVCGCTAHPSMDTAAPTVWLVGIICCGRGCVHLCPSPALSLVGSSSRGGVAGSRGNFTFNV